MPAGARAACLGRMKHAPAREAEKVSMYFTLSRKPMSCAVARSSGATSRMGMFSSGAVSRTSSAPVMCSDIPQPQWSGIREKTRIGHTENSVQRRLLSADASLRHPPEALSEAYSPSLSLRSALKLTVTLRKGLIELGKHILSNVKTGVGVEHLRGGHHYDVALFP